MKFSKADMELLRFLFKVSLDYCVEEELNPFPVKHKTFANFYSYLKTYERDFNSVYFKMTDEVVLELLIYEDYEDPGLLYVEDLDFLLRDKINGYLDYIDTQEAKDKVLNDNLKIAFNILDFKKLCERTK